MQSMMESMVISSCIVRMRRGLSLISTKRSSGRKTCSRYSLISPKFILFFVLKSKYLNCTQCCALNAGLHPSGQPLILLIGQRNSYYRGGNITDGIDNLFNAWHTLRNVHGGNSSEVKSFQRHLGRRLPNGCGRNCADGSS